MSDAEEARETGMDESSPDLGRAKLSAAGQILEGKRAKKTVERLDFQAPEQKKLKIGEGSGEKLGDIPRTNYQITKMKPADLKTLHTILFDRPGQSASIKKTLRLFNGFGFDEKSEQFSKKREKLLKSSNLTNSKLKVVCSVLDLEKKGTHSDLVERILTYLVSPKNSGKRLPVKKKKKSKKKLSGDDSATKAKKKSSKPKPSSSSSPKKSKSASKSKAIVMDSSSDEEEDEKAEAATEAEGSEDEEKASDKDLDRSEKSEQSSQQDSEDEDESPKPKSGKKAAAKKSTPVKRAKTPAKKAAPPKKRAKKDESDGNSSDADEKPKKKPAAKTKKADSSSSKTTNTADDSSDDEPLINMVKKLPSDEQLKETVKGLLEEANLEEMTMKQICQRVFDTFPNQDLSAKKDFIKQTVKSLIT
ncbi:protein DEK [Synchiropus splendidus]|uniref:protein DEK n=1 Tax=Synchiropus splendidus TaxID=270530 RepID=UPI00237D3540|nr:protein DEK [Synchiropus splendidus]XP_053743560.1 protein DEK [Synchiropus splendidus]XP_053743561.1 protein DEK [Synchiropus splendidus]